MNQQLRRALSRYALTFQGDILSVNCQCRMLTRVRRTHSTSPVENSLITNPQEDEMGFDVNETLKEGANKRGNSSRLTQSFHFFMFEPIFSPVNALNQPI
ncbi:TPA: hypothetical protein ACH732_002330 [Escherichia coli]|nr:hypothetical protein [Escherichia coli]ELA5899746.1 hypothetical protein [Escherichia coli]